MNTTIKRPGGVLVRVLTTLNEFKAKHGYWPKKVELEAESLAALATYHLTPLGFFLLQSKIELSPGREGDVVATGREGNAYSYSNELGKFEGASNRADLWLGLEIED